MAAPASPLALQSSKDTGDTRPDTSGKVPSTHFNVPLYQHVPTQTHDPLESGFLNVLSGGAYHDPAAAGAYWKGVAQSFNPTTVEGAANLASNLFPGNLHSGLVPKEIPSSVPGVRIVRAGGKENVLDYTGYPSPISKPPEGFGKGSATVGYNAVNEKGTIVGSISGSIGPYDTYIHQVFVRPDYRSTPLFHDLVRPVIQRGRPVGGYIINPKLKGLVDRLTRRAGGDLFSDIQGVAPIDRSGVHDDPPGWEDLAAR